VTRRRGLEPPPTFLGPVVQCLAKLHRLFGRQISFPVERIVTSRVDPEEIVPAGFEVSSNPAAASEINVVVELARS
jgi:hypothetical protein